MSGKSIFALVFGFVLFVVYVIFFRQIPEDPKQRTIVKKTGHSKEVAERKMSNTSREVASNVITTPKATPEPPDLKTNPFLQEKKIRTQKQNELLRVVTSEQKRPLELQFIGTDRWSFFVDLQVSKEPTHNSLFAVGPYHVVRRDEHGGNKMTLLFNEKNKTLGVLTGRVVLKVRELYDMDPLTREYELKLDKFSPEIKTGYASAVDFARIANLNSLLKTDQRVERFYFEIVNADLVRN